MTLVCGVDEAGRGPLAGPVVAAAVILGDAIPGLADSKKLTAARREELARHIRERSLAWSLGRAEAEEIDRLNIHHATLLAMRRAVMGLGAAPTEILVDGRFCPPELSCLCRAIVKGDASVAAISAASILAKCARDEEMLALHRLYPAYGFDRHKGYPTPDHLAALGRHGPSAIHRYSFRPVRESCSGKQG